MVSWTEENKIELRKMSIFHQTSKDKHFTPLPKINRKSQTKQNNKNKKQKNKKKNNNKKPKATTYKSKKQNKP